MRIAGKVFVFVAVLAGIVLSPRPPANIVPGHVLANVIRANESGSAPFDRVRRCLREHCTPILEGRDVIGGRQTLAIRLRPAHKKYPWLEVWVDEQAGSIPAWKEWGYRDGCLTVLSQSPPPDL